MKFEGLPCKHFSSVGSCCVKEGYCPYQRMRLSHEEKLALFNEPY